jgi:hypothetical protein
LAERWGPQANKALCLCTPKQNGKYGNNYPFKDSW